MNGYDVSTTQGHLRTLTEEKVRLESIEERTRAEDDLLTFTIALVRDYKKLIVRMKERNAQ